MQENQNIDIQIANEQTSIQEPMNDVLGADETIDYNEPQQQIKTKIVETTKKEGLLSRTWNGISTAFTIGTAATAGYLANLFRKSKEDTLQNTVVDSTVKVTDICEVIDNINSVHQYIIKSCEKHGAFELGNKLCHANGDGDLYNGTYNYCYKDKEIYDNTVRLIDNTCLVTANKVAAMVEQLKGNCLAREKRVAYNVDTAFRTMLNSSFEMYKTAHEKIDRLNLVIESGHNITLTLAVINSVWAGMNIIKGGLYGLTLLKNKFSSKNKQQNIQNAIAEVNNQIDRNNTIL